MHKLSKKIDGYLLDLVWSLWNELGAAGIHRHHSQVLIAPEELILLTSLLAETDPRLRDESLDWCSRYHDLISISRMRTLLKELGSCIDQSFSMFAATLNSVSRANWPVPIKQKPLKYTPSGKSRAPEYELPALICLRLRSLFGVGARADLITFFLITRKGDFNAADSVEIGYTKRNLIEILDAFVQAGILDAHQIRNQKRYHFVKQSQFNKLLGALPKYLPPWRQILKIFLPLRESIRRIETKSDALKMVEIRNLLEKLKCHFQQLRLTPPPFQPDFSAYWDSFANWVMNSLDTLITNKRRT